MKNIVLLKVQGLRLYPSAQERISKVNKVKSLRYGALILGDVLPRSEGQTENNAVELSEKQLDNLCTGAGIPGKGRESWQILQGFLLRGGNAWISSMEHKKGDKYPDPTTGEEKEYTETSTSCSVDSIVISQTVVDKLQAKYIDKVVNWNDSADILENVGAGVPESELKVK